MAHLTRGIGERMPARAHFDVRKRDRASGHLTEVTPPLGRRACGGCVIADDQPYTSSECAKHRNRVWRVATVPVIAACSKKSGNLELAALAQQLQEFGGTWQAVRGDPVKASFGCRRRPAADRFRLPCGTQPGEVSLVNGPNEFGWLDP